MSLELLSVSKKAGFSSFSTPPEENGCHTRQKIGCKIDLAAQRISASSLCSSHLPTVGAEGAPASVRSTQVNPRAVRKEFHTYMKKQQHNQPKGRLTPSASSICLQTGRGRIEGVPRGDGRIPSAPLSPSSLPQPLCRRRKRRLRQEVCLLRNRAFKPGLNCAVCQTSNQSCGAAVASFQYD